MAKDSSPQQAVPLSLSSTRRARGRTRALRGGIAVAVLSVALVAPGVNEYASRQLASIAQPKMAREWFAVTHLPLSDAAPERGLSRWVLPSELMERSLWSWDADTLRWMDSSAQALPEALRELKTVNTIYLLPANTRRKEIRREDQIYWTLELTPPGAEPDECGVTYSIGRGIEIALNRECLRARNNVSLSKIVHELTHAWDLEQGDRLAPPQWDERRGLWLRRSLSTWVDAPDAWFGISWKLRGDTLEGIPRSGGDAFVSARARMSPLEDLAETAEQMFLRPGQVRAQAPNKAAWLSERLFPHSAMSHSSHGKKR